MEVTLLSPETIRLRGKTVTVLLNPGAIKIKTPVDAVLFYQRSAENVKNADIEGNKLTIDGAGEYEIGGVKIHAVMHASDIYYSIIMDSIDVLVGKASTLSKIKDDSKECQIAVIESDVLLDETITAAINSSVLIFYGAQAKENIKSLGKEETLPTAKYSVTREKLPTDTQIVLLQ